MATTTNPTVREALPSELGMMFRQFEVVTMTPVKRRTADEKLARVAARAARAVTRAANKAAGKTDDADDDEEDDDGEDEDRSDDTGNEGKEAAGKRDEDRFDISISSEYPVSRWGATEILDHSKDAVDLSRAKLGLSFLDSHDSKSVIGIVEGIKVGDDKKLRGKVRFSRNPAAQSIKQDILDGIRRFISVGYGVNEYTLDKSSKDEGDTYRATNWTPMEVSSVGVPADPTVGNNRAAGERKFPVVLVGSENLPASKPNSREVTVETNTAVTESRTAAAEIFRLGKQHGIDHERTVKMVSDGLTVEQASREILSDVEKRGARPIVTNSAEEQERLNLTEKEQRQYNLARGIMAAVANVESNMSGSAKRENTFELEISDELEKRHTRESHGGLFVPWSIRHAWSDNLEKRFPGQMKTRAGLDSGSSTAGQTLKFTEPGEFIQFLYNRMRVKELGARTIAGLRDNVSYPKQTGRATGSWVGENPGSDVADSALTLGAIASQPHCYQSSSSYSRQLLAQAVVDVDTLVREDLARDLALAVDTAAISGSGSSNQPTGILNTSGVQSYVVEADSANGGAPVWDDIVNMETLIEDVNADQLGNGGWLTTPGVKSRLKRTARLGNTIGLPIWADDDTVDGKMARSTNQVASNGTKGSGTALHTAIYGIFETMIIGMWGSGFELVVDPYRLKKQGMIELTTFMLTDITLKYGPAFVAATDLIVS
jgi:HK97 family phage major capsid protein